MSELRKKYQDGILAGFLIGMLTMALLILIFKQ